MRCLRPDCPNERWLHPVKGALCLCRDHAEAVFSGVAKAPPLRTRPDYFSGPRRAFLVSLPDSDEPTAPSDPRG